jgi:GMP synthase-like glutamine amidotransferase
MTRARSAGKSKKPVLIVQHAFHEHPAAVRRALESQAVRSLLIHPYKGESYPEIDEISGMISLGGPMGANDDSDHPWIPKEVALLKKCVLAELPTVGICLGGQMMARALGGRVEKHHTQEVGWFPIDVNELGQKDPIAGAAGPNPTVYHWHGDTFYLPDGATLLATSLNCERQAYRYGKRAYGFQFHPEADHQLIHEWLSIEGVDQEIADTQKAFGTQTIQDAQTQRNRALRGEKGSLKITAAIGSLFRKKAFGCATHEDYEQLEVWATHRQHLVVEFMGSSGRAVQLLGRIAVLLTIPAGEYMIFQDDTHVLWPLRLEDIVSIRVALA